MSVRYLNSVRRKGRWVTKQRGRKLCAVISNDAFRTMDTAYRLYGIDPGYPTYPRGAA